jgi:hypothetical protein
VREEVVRDLAQQETLATEILRSIVHHSPFWRHGQSHDTLEEAQGTIAVLKKVNL